MHTLIMPEKTNLGYIPLVETHFRQINVNHFAASPQKNDGHTPESRNRCKMKKLLKNAFTTNETQMGAVSILTFLNLMAVLSSGRDIPFWAAVIIVSFWPVLALVVNAIYPIKKE